MKISSDNPPSYLSNYFSIISYLIDADEVAKLEQLLKMIEQWPNEMFTKQSMLKQLKDDVKEMKKSILKNGKEKYMERVNAIIKRLGISYEEIDTEMMNEFRLKQLHD